MTAQQERTTAPSDLAHRASRGTLVTAGGLWGRALLQTASTVVLARLLDPTDFGLLAMITAIVGVADLVRDFGLTAALIQSRTMTSRLWSSALWLSVVLGVVLSVAVVLLAPVIALLYDEPRLVLLTIVIAPTLFVNGLAMPMQAKLQRELRFTTLAHIDVGSMLTGVVLSIAAALLGWGVWSLVLLAGAGQVYRLVALWICARPRFGRPRISREVLPLVSTGGSVFGVQLLNYAARNLDNVIIGYQLGPQELGYYSRAYALFLLPLQQLNGPLGRVALPVLSTLRDEPERFRNYVRGAVLVIGYLTIPTYAVAAAVSGPLIALLLGPGWEPAALVFSLLAVAGVVQAVGSVQGWLYLTLERAHRQLVYYAITRPLVIGGFFLGIWWGGIDGVALVYSAITLVLAVPGFWFAIRGTFVHGSDIVGPLLRPAIVAVPAFAAAFAVVQLVDTVAVLELLAGGAAGLVPIAAAFAVPAYRRDIRRIAGFVAQVRRRRPAAPEPGAPEPEAV
ncbi:lipopolysaccharide biosynthesis protein [Protaetiibacter mangrovi]|uniref:Lipopolysaccharide biosynthesis protein n=1 Tax=Protaetiibacter mangrovi TaxID=2970926 RepID=A0ABT1ZBI2_9MICO|nr:lipopolysaccharide biosynthesis protein [Protaetiibacter mangrovi]MCS0498048.1 lipopolysaccharide biosynthesis protein [Protaetiibacter mangrovi]